MPEVIETVQLDVGGRSEPSECLDRRFEGFLFGLGAEIELDHRIASDPDALDFAEEDLALLQTVESILDELARVGGGEFVGRKYFDGDG